MHPEPTVDDIMAAYAEDAVDYCSATFRVPLDYSEDSIEKIEAVLASLHDQLPRGFVAKLFKKGPPPEVIDQLAKMLGGYVGEVMRRNWGGRWKLGSDAFPGDEIYTLEISGRGDVWPHFKVGKRILNGPDENVLHYFQMLKRKYSDRSSEV